MEQTGSRESRLRRAMPRIAAAVASAAVALAASVPAAAQTINQPQPWQMGMMAPQSEVAQSMVSFHNGLLWVITLITLFVGALLLVCIFRFNEKKNPKPSKTSHNTMIEVAWTVIPILILVGIAIPSFRLLRDQLIIPEADVVVKATGNSWYWEYEYPEDQGGFSFISAMLEREDAEASGQPYLLAVDNEMVVPVGANVAVQVTSQGVLHSFAMPSFGIKTDAVPGRLNETWFRAEREGMYYGQCSELCGSGHAFMPIAIRVVSEEAYAEWLDEARAMFASVDGDRQVASSD